MNRAAKRGRTNRILARIRGGGYLQLDENQSSDESSTQSSGRHGGISSSTEKGSAEVYNPVLYKEKEFIQLDQNTVEDINEGDSNQLSPDIPSYSEEEEEEDQIQEEVTMATNVDSNVMDGVCQSSIDLNELDLPSLTRHVFKTLPFKFHMDSFKKTKNRKSSKHDNADTLLRDMPEVIKLDDGEEKSLSTGLSSELKPEMKMDNLYLKIDTDDSKPVEIVDKGSRSDEALMKRSVLGPNLEKLETAPKVYESRHSVKKRRKKLREETAGPGWYNLPKTELTDEVKRDLQVIKMRNALDSKRHYKKDNSKELPKYFQVGTVVAGSAEFYSSRLTKKERKRTIVDQLLSDAEFRRKNKKKYLELQKKRQSGGKLYHRKLKNKRKPSSMRT